MNRVKMIGAVLALLAVSASACLAEMPKELKGTWILDKEATVKAIKTSPKWKEEDAAILRCQCRRVAPKEEAVSEYA